MSSKDIFGAFGSFCPDCGSILPPPKEKGGIVCYTCSRKFPADVFEGYKVTYTINFNSGQKFDSKKDHKKIKDENEGPVVDRKCPKCGNDKMSYATVQLRSADEGQTVFYTCIKCKFKESENS
ncbi:DNA-directed RNA polymerase I subunit RPA12 [Tenebrio molitor]|jgi:DNA-directed RNA polymerase I subunit RPA12|uniref:DNA-directed RNA polymerase I subunit RPA12 n=1 Tax=Tenebrio molitor TaxID=7067 RepID=UPI003624953B